MRPRAHTPHESRSPLTRAAADADASPAVSSPEDLEREVGSSYKWIALSNTTLGVLMVTINASILLIALPDIFKGIKLNPLQPSNTSFLLWLIMGFLVVTAVLVVSFGRIGDMYGRVKMYNLGFAVFTLFSILLSATWMTGVAGAWWLIIMRVLQGVGGAFLFANSSAILTDAFPAHQRGLALGINNVAGIAGSFIGLVVGGLLGPVDWHLVFLVSVPFGLFGTVWAYLKLVDTGKREKAKLDWWGNITFAVGLIAVLVGITYGIQPYGGHTMGWTNPYVLAAIIGGIAVLILFVLIEQRVDRPDVPPEPVPHPGVHRRQPRQPAVGTRTRWPAVHPDHLAAGDLAPAARLQLRADPAVGGHLHAAAHRRFPARRAARRGAVRPLRRAPVRHRRHDHRRRQLRAAALPPGELQLHRVRRDPRGQRHRHGHVRLAQPGRNHERAARRGSAVPAPAWRPRSRTRRRCCRSASSSA